MTLKRANSVEAAHHTSTVKVGFESHYVHNLKYFNMDWNDINIRTWMKIKDYLAPGEELSSSIGIISEVFGFTSDEVSDMSLDEFTSYIKKLEFMSSEVVPSMPKERYLLNGREYNLVMDVRKVSAGMWIDFQSMPKDDYIGLLSIFMIPRGKTYNTGYDILTAREDIGSMPLPDVLGVMAFFLISYRAYTQALLRYSLRKIHPRNEKEKELKSKIKKMLDMF